MKVAESAARSDAPCGTVDPSSLMLLMVACVEYRLFNQAIAVSDELEPLIADEASLLRLRAHVHGRMGLIDLAEKDLAQAERLAVR